MQSVQESIFMQALDTFLIHTKSNSETHKFVLNHILQKVNQEHLDQAFLYLYDKHLTVEENSCEPESDQFKWARDKASILKNVQTGKTAPDFTIQETTLHNISSKYILLVFWATWCPHCTQALPEIIEKTSKFSTTTLTKVAVSLDNEKSKWEAFIKANNMSSWRNISELKGWNGEISRNYNVYATPTLFLLDKDKKIIAKPEIHELGSLLKSFDYK